MLPNSRYILDGNFTALEKLNWYPFSHSKEGRDSFTAHDCGYVNKGFHGLVNALVELLLQAGNNLRNFVMILVFASFSRNTFQGFSYEQAERQDISVRVDDALDSHVTSTEYGKRTIRVSASSWLYRIPGTGSHVAASSLQHLSSRMSRTWFGCRASIWMLLVLLSMTRGNCQCQACFQWSWKACAMTLQYRQEVYCCIVQRQR